jgi:dTMP kinase
VYTAFARDVARGVNREWVRSLYGFAVKPTVGFYFRVALDEAMKRLRAGRAEFKYYEAGADVGLADDLEESFRIFQGRIIEEYESMVEEFGLVVIDASLPVEEQQTRMRQVVVEALTGVKKTRSTRWVDLASLARESRE